MIRRTRMSRIIWATLVLFAPPLAAAADLEIIQGAPMITVLPMDAIRAIDSPGYVPVEEADRFMRPDEPVLGITDGKVAKAYSTWQLNHHEIVNDGLGELPLAVTW